MRKLPNFLVRPYTKFFLLVLALVIFFALVIVLSSQETTETEDTSALIAGSPVTFDTNKLSAKIKNSIQTGTYIEENDSLQKQLSATSKNEYTNKSNSIPKLFSSTNNGSIKQKVLVIIYDTHNLPTHNTYPYNDPVELTSLLENAMQVASKERGFLNNDFSTENVDIQIVDTIRYESRAPQIPGTTIPNHRTFDYIKMLNTHSICNRVNNGEIDEVWLWADRTGGFAEALMAGPSNQIFHTNGQPFVKKDCNRAIHIMGFNYERWVDQAVHSMGHRGESVLSVFLDNTLSEKPGDNSYEYMGVQSTYTPGEGWVYCVGNKNYIGNIHCPPNSQFQYKYAEPDVVNSDLKDWYPQHIGIKSTISSSTWNQSHLKYLVQWFQNFPSKEYAPYLTKINGEPMIDMWTAFYKNQFLVPPKIYRCNTICTQDSQCSSVNSNWFCSQQYDFGTWSDKSSNISTIQYVENGITKSDSGPNFNFNQYVDNGIVEQHLVKSNKIYYRNNTPNQGWSSWTNITSNVSNVGCNLYSDCGGSIIGFNSYIKPNGKTEQHLLRRNSTSFKLFSRSNDNGWSQWVDSTSAISSIGSGPISNFTSYTHKDGYKVQNIVRGGILWERTDLGGWKPWAINSGLNNCGGAGNGLCGTGALISIERSVLSDGRDVLHVLRENNKTFSREGSPKEERCRAKTNIWSSTCN